jgi:hypothetical protein
MESRHRSLPVYERHMFLKESAFSNDVPKEILRIVVWVRVVGIGVVD